MSAPVFKRVVLTGASGGVGRALTAQLAAPGVSLLLIGRNAARLESAGRQARALGAQVRTARLSVGDAAGMRAAVQGFDDAGAVDLVICNAGASAGLRPDGALERPEETRNLIETNLIGAVNTAGPLIARMRARRAGRIALVGSVSGLSPLAEMPGYSASKAGLHAWGEALRVMLAPAGVGVTVIAPGFVTSPMSARHLGPKPFEIPAARAARIILRGLARGRSWIVLPWPWRIICWLDALAPPFLRDRVVRGFSARIAPETETQD